MSVQDLYIVRTEKLLILGPMPLSDLRQAFKRMEFGLGDEVCGNIGPWMRLDDATGLKKTYPKLLIAMGKDIPGAQKILSEATAKMKEGPAGRRRSPRSMVALNVVLAAVVVVSGVAGFNQMKRARQMAMSLSKDIRQVIQQARQLHRAGDAPAFSELLESNLAKLQAGLQSNKALTADVQGLLRAYAIETGKVLDPALTPRSLYGSEELDRSCTDQAWQAFFEKNIDALPAFALGEQLNLEPFHFKALLWDKQWLDRRQYADWLGAGNPHIACLKAGRRAFDALIKADKASGPSIERKTLAATILRDRFRVLTDDDAAVREVYRFATYSSPFVFLNCVDTAWSLEQYEQCDDIRGAFADAWEAYLKLAVQTRGLPVRLLKAVEAKTADMERIGERIDPHGFTFKEEDAFFASSLRSGGDFVKADQTVRGQYPYFFFNLSPPQSK